MTVFNQVSLDGHSVDAHSDMSWAHAGTRDPEWQTFVEDNAKAGCVLVFGRITYELMAGYWPTPTAAQNDPVVAARMNSLPKIVSSRSLGRVSRNNTILVKTDPVAEVRRLKQEPAPDMVILGSGTIVSRLAAQRLIDEYQVVMIPVVLGQGRTMFEGLNEKLPLKLTRTRAFGNGNVLLCCAQRT